jgi:hypothetical protein
MDSYCLKCHEDGYKSWFHSAHHFSSFNNKAYLASVRETRQVSLKRDGSTRAARYYLPEHAPDADTRTDPAGDPAGSRRAEPGARMSLTRLA